jgi:hypothetical protein
MPRLPWILLAFLAPLLFPDAASAQKLVRRLKIDKESVQVGFASAGKGSDYGFKAGLWTAVIVRFVDDEQGEVRLPVADDGTASGELLVEVPDNDNVFNTYPQKFTLSASGPLQVVTYTKIAGSFATVKISVRSGSQTVTGFDGHFTGIDVDHNLYLTLNDTLPDLNDALVRMVNPNAQNEANTPKETRPRYLTYENKPENLPALWFGYNAVDLALLVTANDSFLTKLLDRNAAPQLQALADWVRRGGRLVVSIAPANREKVQRFLAAPVWQPALPAVLSVDSKTYKLSDLDNQLRNWPGGQQERFKPGKDGKPTSALGVRLQPHPAVTVLCIDKDGQESVPLIVRFPHGLGSITLLGFDVKDPFLSDWSGRFHFWQKVVNDFAPAVPAFVQNNPQQMNRRGGEIVGSDLTTTLYQQLDTFDTPTISFGWVVLFIFLYILVVGPIDYLVLKLLFKRLELTWLTFPAVVITVSLLAYFTAYAIKGQDLKVNKIDLIDIDMRSGFKEDNTPGTARAFGTSWIAILSPRIQNYTIGLEPMLYDWQGLEEPAQPVESTVSWLARPETAGMSSSGRGRSTSLFSRAYSYEPRAVGLRDVPIPVWTTKSFTASWEAPFTKLPFDVKLHYEPRAVGNTLGGTITNNLTFNLKECALIYRGSVYFLPDLPKGVVVPIAPDQMNPRPLTEWALSNANQPQIWNQPYPSSGSYDPTGTLRQLMFLEKTDPNHRVRNHAHRNLDISWRLKDDTIKDQQIDETSVREAFLVCRVPRARGVNETLHTDKDLHLPTHLWLGELPGTAVPGKTRTVTRPDGKTEAVPALAPRPALQGTLIQDTYVRVLLPVTPKKQQ